MFRLTLKDDFKDIHRAHIYEDKFCSEENIEECIEYLSKELELLGFPSINSSNSSEHCDLFALINVTYQLFQLRFLDVSTREEENNRHQKTLSELDQIYNANSRLQKNFERKSNKITSLEDSIRQLNLNLKESQVQIKQDKEEIRRLNVVVTQRHVQYQHEVRKLERDNASLKDRLRQCLSDKGTDRRYGIDAINSLQRSDGQRSKWKNDITTSHTKEEFYNHVLNTFKNRENQLLEENMALRDFLANLQDEYQLFLSSLNMADEDEFLSKEFYQMPFNLVEKQIESTLLDKWKKIKDYVSSIKENNPLRSVSLKEQEEEVYKLRNKLESMDNIILQQQEIIESFTQPCSPNPNLSDGYILEELERLKKQKSLFYEQKSNFEKERRAYTEAAIKLGNEKKVFDSQKNEFLKNYSQKLGENIPRLIPASVALTTPDGKIQSVSRNKKFHHRLSVDGNFASSFCSLGSEDSFSHCEQLPVFLTPTI